MTVTSMVDGFIHLIGSERKIVKRMPVPFKYEI